MRHRQSLAPAALLFSIMTAHTILETARDALLLAKLGPGHLTWAYLAIAVVAFIAVVSFRKWGRLRDPRYLLVAFLVVATLGTSVLAATITLASSITFVLYVWTGLVATLVVPAFWTMMDRNLRIADAKRLFAGIGAGGALGAMTGSAIAGGLGRLMPAHHLITVGAAAFAAAAIAGVTLSPRTTATVAPRVEPRDRRPNSYVRWLFGIVLVSTIALTIGDLTFKRVIAERLPPEDLASAFGAIYTGLNVLSLVLQVGLTPVLLSRFGVGGALLILPVILATGSLGFVASGALVAIIVMKLGDGSLRHSLHRVATEILYVPMPVAVRDAMKPIADAFGHRGGQAVAAIVMLVVAAMGAGTTSFALITAVVALGWLVMIVLVRARYIQQFRDTLRAGEVHRGVKMPELDATSRELLVASLSSPDELEALAALEILALDGGRIPALMLYHPRSNVARRALQLLDPAPGPEVEQVLAHLLDHSDSEVRAAALAAAIRSGCHPHRVLAALADPDPDVRAIALLSQDDPTPGLQQLLAGSTSDRLAVARALALVPVANVRSLIQELLARREPMVMREILRLLARSPELIQLERLRGMLAEPHVRADVRKVYLAAGELGLQDAIEALDDPRTPVTVRRHLPRTISLFGSRTAAAALVERLPREPDGITEFKILRALGRMRENNPRLPIDTSIIRAYALASVADAARYATLADRLAEETERTPGLELVAELLAEKQQFAIEHVFRALHILSPLAGLHSVHDAFTSPDPDRRGNAREIIDHLVRSEIRIPLLALLDEVPAETRRRRLGPLAAGPFPTYESVLATLLADRSDSLRCVVAHHVAERRLHSLRPELVRLNSLDSPPLVARAYEQAIARLDA